MTVGNLLNCPSCGGESKHYDCVDRIIKTKGGVKNIIRIRRSKCLQCNRIFRNIPFNLSPHKHYDSEIISGVIEGYITPDTIGYEDYPCEVTMNRWKNAKNTESLMRKN